MAKRIFKFKTLFSVLAVLILALAFAFTGCAEYTPPTDVGTTPGGTTPGGEQENPNPPAEEGGFTVQLIYSRGDFTQNVCKDITKIQAQWTDMESGQVYRAYFDKDGIAKRSDLDGNYRVTLVTLPVVGETEYTYRPNINKVNNDSKDVRIMLYPITPISLSMQPYNGWSDYGEGNLYYYMIDAIGAYRVVLHDPNEKVYFTFKSSEQGEYSLKTLIDISRDEVNPLVDVFFGAFPYYVNHKLDPQNRFDGGAGEEEEGEYTKNVLLKYYLTKKEVGNGLTFRLYSTCRNDPVYAYGNGLVVDFIIDRDGSYENAYYESVEVPVTENFENRPELPPGNYKQVTVLDETNRNILDQDSDKYKIMLRNENEGKKDAGGNDLPALNYYWIYEKTGDKNNPTLVPKARLYAKLTTGNLSGSLLIDFGSVQDLNYVATNYDPQAYFYTWFVQDYLKNCHENGCYPVTEELQIFLQRFAVYRRLFNDGNTGYGLGLAEEYGYNSDEASQWLFACGFFE